MLFFRLSKFFSLHDPISIAGSLHFLFCLPASKTESRILCPDEEKWCSARALVIIESCRAEILLSNDIKYVMIGSTLTELHIPEHTTFGTHRNREMPNYLPLLKYWGKILDYENKEKKWFKTHFY